MVEGLTRKVLLAIACCFVLALAPISTFAALQGGVIQGTTQGVKKGAKAVGKGVETGAEKTKEGAEAVGKGVKDAVTGDDSDSSKDRMKPSETQQDKTTTGTTTRSTTKSTKGTKGSEEKGLPATAGELPLLALAGAIGLVSAGALKVVRRTRKAE